MEKVTWQGTVKYLLFTCWDGQKTIEADATEEDYITFNLIYVGYQLDWTGLG
jgi:hypothetical protein